MANATTVTTGPPTATRPDPRRRLEGRVGHLMLEVLRGDHRRRPTVDPTLAGGLREWLEDGLSGPCARLGSSYGLVVSVRTLSTGDRAVASAPNGDGSARPAPSMPILRGALVANLFRQLVTTGRIGDPMDDAVDALMVDPLRSDLAASVRSLRGADRARLRTELTRHAASLQRHWDPLPPHWLPKTGDRITVPLAGGGLVLSGSIDLLIGTPSAGRASVCLVQVIAGTPRPEHRDELHRVALLETLRSGAAPFRVVSHYTLSGETHTEDLTEEHLATAVQRTIDGVRALCERQLARQGIG
jgi:hypothetical protein